MYEYKVKEVVKVVDGDKLIWSLILGLDSTKERVRVAGIDASWVSTRDKQEKQYGLIKAWMKGMLSDREGLTEVPEQRRMVSMEECWVGCTRMNCASTPEWSRLCKLGLTMVVKLWGYWQICFIGWLGINTGSYMVPFDDSFITSSCFWTCNRLWWSGNVPDPVWIDSTIEWPQPRCVRCYWRSWEI